MTATEERLPVMDDGPTRATVGTPSLQLSPYLSISWDSAGRLVVGISGRQEPLAIDLADLDLMNRFVNTQKAGSVVHEFLADAGEESFQARARAWRKVMQWRGAGMLIPSTQPEPYASQSPLQRWRRIPEFSSAAGSLRAIFEKRFAPPAGDRWAGPAWEYIDTPLYRYFRTDLRTAFGGEAYATLVSDLHGWGRENLACTEATPVFLHCHLDGCWHGLHADIYDRYDWAFVFSLTRSGGFSGGETQLLSAQTLDYWRAFAKSRTQHEPDLVDQVAPEFNQLLVFDPRIPHGVRPVTGTRSLLRGRVTIIGHFSNARLVVTPNDVADRALAQLDDVHGALAQSFADVDDIVGALVLRAEFGTDGRVASVETLANSMHSTVGDLAAPAGAVELLAGLLSKARISPIAEPLRVCLPFSAR